MNGLLAILYGQVESRPQDSSILALSRQLDDLQQHFDDPNRSILCIRPYHQTLFEGANLTPLHKQWDKSMSQVRVSGSGFLKKFFKFLDLKGNLKVQLGAVGKIYIVCALLQNARSCLYGSTTSEYFGICPPQLEEYFV